MSWQGFEGHLKREGIKVSDTGLGSTFTYLPFFSGPLLAP